MHTNNIDINNNTVLITGSSGFVGSNLVMELIRRGKRKTLRV